MIGTTRNLFMVLSLGIISSIILIMPVCVRAVSASSGARSARKRMSALTTIEKRIARAIASGKPVVVIIRQLVAAGKSIDIVVEAMIEAGGDPSAVVYTAIMEGHSVRNVVAVALKTGVTPSFVVHAALCAGADERIVYLGATDAGLSPGVVATAVTVAKARGLTIGDIALRPTTEQKRGESGIPVSFTGIRSLGTIGGGGGAVPRTQIASPYRP